MDILTLRTPFSQFTSLLVNIDLIITPTFLLEVYLSDFIVATNKIYVP